LKWTVWFLKSKRIRFLLESCQDPCLYTFINTGMYIYIYIYVYEKYVCKYHCCYRLKVICVETNMETWLVRFVYRTPFRKKGTVMDSTAPIYLFWNLIEDSLEVNIHTVPTFHSSSTLRTSWLCYSQIWIIRIRHYFVTTLGIFV